MSGLDRREFLGASAALAAGLAGPRARADEKKHPSPNEKITVALIGCGGMGRANLADFLRLPDFEVIALCDPDPGQIAGAVNDIQKANRPTEKVQKEKDFRKVLERKDLDAVIVGTPDHWHAYVLIAACASGKDVYCEKPLSHNIVEGRAMVNAARRHKRVVQIGTQQRSGKHFQDAVRYVHSGKLGKIFLCRTWITNGTPADELDNPPDGDAPAGVDHNLWLGPAPERRFNPNRFHHHFRWWWDYGNGLCNDWGVHLNDLIMWGLKVTAPLSVSALGGKEWMRDNSDTPDTLDVYYEYPGFTHIYTVRRGQNLYGFHGMNHGMEFQGTNGTLTLDRGGWWVTPAPGSSLEPERHGGSEQHFAHVKNFLECLRRRNLHTASDIETVHRVTTTCHLANISYKIRRRVYWDPNHERCYGGYDPEAKKYLHEDGEANAYLLREPRQPWAGILNEGRTAAAQG
jgi:predicted dehydrogenase